MQNKSVVCVITTIQTPTAAMIELSRRVRAVNGHILVAGDAKGPQSFELDDTEFLSLGDQLALPFKLVNLLPTGHYCRKNLAYIQAVSHGAPLIYETDDDNEPMSEWCIREKQVTANAIEKKGWLNVYQYFSSKKIWPRGFPLDELAGSFEFDQPGLGLPVEKLAPIQQGLANLSPDVDAVWRLVMDQIFEFDNKPSVYLAPGTWCPFNSQSTWWWPEAYPLMYLPSFCSFRMTDIWRSFIAQRCLWAMGHGLVFHTAEVIQERNEHDLMKDFADEVPGYLRNKELVEVLDGLDLKRGEAAVGENLLICYEALVAKDFFPHKELALVQAWLEDMKVATSKMAV